MISYLKITAALAGVAVLALTHVGLSAQAQPSDTPVVALVASVPDVEMPEHTLASTDFFDGINVSAIAIGAYE